MSPADAFARAASPGADDFDRLARSFERAKPAGGPIDVDRVIAGVPIRFSFATEAMRERLVPALAGSAPGPSLPSPPRFTLLIWDSASTAVPLPEMSWRLEDVSERGEVPAVTNETIRTAFFLPSFALSTLDLERRVGLFWTRDAQTLPSWERAAPLRTLLHWIVDAAGGHLMHAAAVATANGGALLAGPGGSGKSTTAMLAVRAGFRYAGDDYVAVRSADEAVTAHAVYVSAKLAPRSLELLPELRPHVEGVPAQDEKAVTHVSTFSADSVADSFPLRALIVPRVAGGQSRITRTTAAAALRALAPTTLFQLPGADAASFAVMASVARRLPAWQLELGDDLDRIPALIEQAIEGTG